MNLVPLSVSLLILLNTSIAGFSQPQSKKTLHAGRVQEAPVIDGYFEDDAWFQADTAADFVQYEPFNGVPTRFPTIVRIVYDDQAIYIAAEMIDEHPDSILKEMGQRDELLDLNADAFMIYLTPFNDGLNSFGYGVTASGVQHDEKLIGTSSDTDWDAVWDYAVRIHENGWNCEMRIPFSAIRFPEADKQVWGLNIWRQVRRVREISTWNYVDKDLQNEISQSGLLLGIEDVDVPVRLSLVPYAAVYLNTGPGKGGLRYSGGLDLKYGLNQGFTLDLTLIPDFGQVESDDIVLNLSPFEIYYQEKRSFFTEGNELFGRAGIFYSRRIGHEPEFLEHGRDSLMEGESLGSYPVETPLLNAAKLSGRNRNGLGVGVFNALTAPVDVIATDSDGVQRELRMQPLMNYNLAVLDQSLPNNSCFSFINTNVVRTGESYMANVSAVDLQLYTPDQKYGVSGIMGMSNIYKPGEASSHGFKYWLEAGKRSGRLRWSVGHFAIDKSYDQNDMGYMEHGNLTETRLNLKYQMFEPKGPFINYNHSFEALYSTLYDGYRYVMLQFSANSFFTFRNYLSAGASAEYFPLGADDYFEPRVEGMFLHLPGLINGSIFISPDYRKTFVIDARIGAGHAANDPLRAVWMSLGPRFRASDRLMFIYRLENSRQWDELGFAGLIDDSEVYIGRRDINTVSQNLRLTYRISPHASLNFRVRHYWSAVKFTSFHLLQADGSTLPDDQFTTANINFNNIAIDAGLKWYFAPGSEMSLVWKSYTSNSEDKLRPRYVDNLSNTLDVEGQGSISLRVLYYIDYHTVKTSLKKNSL